MFTEYVLFDLPPGLSRDEVVRDMEAVAPRWRGHPGLLRKTFVHDPVAGQAGAFYLWRDRASGEAAHDAAWRAGLKARYGCEPVIRWFETPVVVDNGPPGAA